jgi:hypothetical protein
MTVTFRIQVQARLCGICDGRSDTLAGCLRVRPFPLPVAILPTATHSSSSACVIRGRYNSPNCDLHANGLSVSPVKLGQLCFVPVPLPSDSGRVLHFPVCYDTFST